MHLICIRNDHTHIRKLSLESTEISLEMQHKMVSFLIVFVWLFLQEDGKRCLKSQAEGHRTPKKRSSPLGTITFSSF